MVNYRNIALNTGIIYNLNYVFSFLLQSRNIGDLGTEVLFEISV